MGEGGCLLRDTRRGMFSEDAPLRIFSKMTYIVHTILAHCTFLDVSEMRAHFQNHATRRTCMILLFHRKSSNRSGLGRYTQKPNRGLETGGVFFLLRTPQALTHTPRDDVTAPTDGCDHCRLLFILLVCRVEHRHCAHVATQQALFCQLTLHGAVD